MKTFSKVLALALVGLGIVATGGCSAEQDDSSDGSGETQDELSLRTGTVDHAAIVEVTTMMLTSATEPVDFATVLDPYNEDDPFKINARQYQAQFARNMAKYDGIDGHTDWTPAQQAKWVNRIASGNYQIIDTSKPCDYNDPHTYLEIERAFLTGRQHTTCGGRMPNEDAMDVTLNFLIRGPAASMYDAEAFTDGVDEATKPSTDEFPYLGEMNGF